VPEEAEDHITAFVDELINLGLVGSDITASSSAGNMEKTKLHLEGHSDEPHRDNDTGTLKYERPMLMGFNQVAYGTCSYGSGDSDNCQVGLAANFVCTTVGTSAYSGCAATGNAASAYCASVGNSPYGPCYGGSGGPPS
jgi:hypothetical protein